MTTEHGVTELRAASHHDAAVSSLDGAARPHDAAGRLHGPAVSPHDSAVRQLGAVPEPAVAPAPEPDQIDVHAATTAARDFLVALGVDVTREGLADTPARMTRAYAELFTPRPFTATTFPNDAHYDELVIARGIPLVSVCEHHLLPFTGTATVGYLPGRRILGLSKLARLVEHFARRPQLQERLTQQIANWLTDQLAPKGVGVLINAEHTCMTLRGAQAVGSTTVTSALLGNLRHDPNSRAEFFALAGAQ